MEYIVVILPFLFFLVRDRLLVASALHIERCLAPRLDLGGTPRSLELRPCPRLPLRDLHEYDSRLDGRAALALVDVSKQVELQEVRWACNLDRSVGALHARVARDTGGARQRHLQRQRRVVLRPRVLRRQRHSNEQRR